MTRSRVVVALALLGLPTAFVGEQVLETLRVLSVVERERDTWQRPDDVLHELGLRPGNTVVDLGSGAGYFSLKLAARVGAGGRVVAIDLRRQSLAFLWLRATWRGDWNMRIVLGKPDDPSLPAGPVDAVLIANTFHELAAPEPVLRAVLAAMRPGARLVVVDRGPRDDEEPRSAGTAHHEVTTAGAEHTLTQLGFQTVSVDGRFIDRPGEDGVWWLAVFRKP